MARRALTDADRALWQAVTRDVRALAGRADPPKPDEPPAKAEPAAKPAAPTPPSPARSRRAEAPTILVGSKPTGLDKGTWTRLESGRTAPERRLDLHGRTVQQAFHALDGFLHATRADGLRCVEVVTGRGTGEAGGAIRRELPMWLNLPKLRPLILAVTYPHPANQGAVRILLRRFR
jgi:DNA-nicking Smr family endonuclease